MRDISFVNSIGISEYIYSEVDEYLTRLKNAIIISLRLRNIACLFGTRCINLVMMREV